MDKKDVEHDSMSPSERPRRSCGEPRTKFASARTSGVANALTMTGSAGREQT